jgi:hypothetical protein
LWLFAAVASALFLRSPVAAAESSVTKEYQIKAAFLYNFTKFVEWPADRFKHDRSPIVIGVLGKNPFGEELEKIVRDRKVNRRDITILQLQTAGDALSTHAVFVAAGEEGLVEKEIGSLTCAGVLVVGESERFCALGGTVTFTTAGDKVRFEINVGAAERGGVKISAQLQKLAAVVSRKP